jgi:hypothetical protein
MSSLGETVRAKIRAGALPRDRPDKIFAGHGETVPCSACDTAILPAQVEWSFRNRGAATYRFHLGCYALWEVELHKTGVPQSRQLETVVTALSRHSAGLCVPCLSDVTGLAPHVLAAAVGRLSQTLNVAGREDACGVCGHKRYLVKI